MTVVMMLVNTERKQNQIVFGNSFSKGSEYFTSVLSTVQHLSVSLRSDSFHTRFPFLERKITKVIMRKMNLDHHLL